MGVRGLENLIRIVPQEDVLAIIEEGMSQAEIVEYLGISISQVKYTASKLRKEGRLKGKNS